MSRNLDYNEGHMVKLLNTPLIENLLSHFNMIDCIAVVTPLSAGPDLSSGNEDVLDNSTHYPELIGASKHLANMLGLTYRTEGIILHYLCTYQLRSLWTAGKHILRYLKGTKLAGIIYCH